MSCIYDYPIMPTEKERKALVKHKNKKINLAMWICLPIMSVLSLPFLFFLPGIPLVVVGIPLLALILVRRKQRKFIRGEFPVQQGAMVMGVYHGICESKQFEKEAHHIDLPVGETNVDLKTRTCTIHGTRIHFFNQEHYEATEVGDEILVLQRVRPEAFNRKLLNR